MFKKYTKIHKILIKFHTKLHPQLRQNRASFERLREYYYWEFWHDAARKVEADIEHIGDHFLRISKDNKWTVVNNGNVMLDDHVTLNMAANKTLIQTFLKQIGCPTPKTFEYRLNEIDSAFKFQKDLGRKVVVKPKFGSSGRGVTVNIETKKQLSVASIEAASIHPQLILEEHIKGASFRLLYLRGNFIDAVRRDPPIITGDGENNLKALIYLENKKRTTQVKIEALSPLAIDAECVNTLKKQGLDLKYVPQAGERVRVMDVSNLNSCYENHIVKDQVHPDTITMGAKASAYFGIDLAGVDIMAKDISAPLEGGNGVINEINTTPGLHHHDLVSETHQRCNIGKIILADILANSSLEKHHKSLNEVGL